MTLFDLAAGLVLLVSALVGWIRGGTREVSTVVAFILAAVVALFSLRFTGAIARHAIHTVWLANVVALLLVFVLAYILLRVSASALSRRMQQTTALGTIDRIIGVGFGLLRALVVLGLFNLLITAATPPERIPPWIRGATLYPLSAGAAQVLRTLTPQGLKLAKQVAPTVQKAVTDHGVGANSAADQGERPDRGSTPDDPEEKSR